MTVTQVRTSTLQPIDRELQGLDDIELKPEPVPVPTGLTPNEYARRRRAQLKKSGLCGYGCGRRARKGKYACTVCVAKYRKGGPYGCDKPGRNHSRTALGLPDRRRKEYRDMIRGGPPIRRHRGPRTK
jgi:hypothetical protein